MAGVFLRRPYFSRRQTADGCGNPLQIAPSERVHADREWFRQSGWPGPPGHSARALLVMVIVHPLTFIVPNVLADPSRTIDWLAYLFFDRRFLTGTVSGVATILLVEMALYRGKLARYGAWRASHGLLALAAIRYERFDYADEARSAKDRRLLVGFAAIAAAVTAAIAVFSRA